MKVAKLPGDFDKFAPHKRDLSLTKIQKSEVKDLELNQGLQQIGSMAVKKAPTNVWAEFNFHDLLAKDVNRKEKKLTKLEKERYEWFCAGFLYYYDTILRNEAVDHTIYFKWELAKVTIYMDPPPAHAIAQNYAGTVTTTTDPPKPPAPPPPPLNT